MKPHIMELKEKENMAYSKQYYAHRHVQAIGNTYPQTHQRR